MQRVKEDIKNRNFHRFYLFYGEEDYLKKTYKNSLKNAVLADSDEMNYSYFEGRNIDVLDILEAVNTLPFFSDYRIVVAEDSGLFKSANTLADSLEDMPGSTVVVFIEKEVDKRNRLYKYVNKNGIAIEMKQMDAAHTKSFIVSLLKENSKQMRGNTADYFLQQVNNSLSNVKNEIDKLISYTDGRSEITKEDIDAVCCIQPENHVFQMIDYAVAGKKAEALKLYSDLLELRESPMSILYLMSRHFNILLQVKASEGTPKNEIASKLSLPAFAVGKYIGQAKRFGEGQLKKMLEDCIETEYKFKRGMIGDQTGVELLLVQLVQH